MKFDVSFDLLYVVYSIYLYFVIEFNYSCGGTQIFMSCCVLALAAAVEVKKPSADVNAEVNADQDVADSYRSGYFGGYSGYWRGRRSVEKVQPEHEANLEAADQ